MSETTNIAWCDSTWNPWEGCSKISPGCDSCYAEARNQRFHGGVNWGPGAPRRRTSPAYWRQPLAWDRKARESGKPWRVFCGSLCDVFDNEVPEGRRRDLFELICATDNLTWLLLTKRIGNAKTMLPIHWWGKDGPPPNVWLGATVVNQEEADRDIPKLLAVPAAVRFLSIEPMLGPIDLTEIQTADGEQWNCLDRVEAADAALEGGCSGTVDWVIVGGESTQPGHPARPFNIEWARDIMRQCKAAQVPVFVKQLGSHVAWNGCSSPGEHWPRGTDKTDTGRGYWRMLLRDRAGADPSEWPEDLRVREFPR